MGAEDYKAPVVQGKPERLSVLAAAMLEPRQPGTEILVSLLRSYHLAI